jgi:hypothetical protein
MITPYIPAQPKYNEKEDKIGLPEKFGPGAWWILSVNAAMANNTSKMLDFTVFLRKVVDTLPCPKCHAHAAAYITTNNPNSDKYFSMKDPKTGENIGMAYYIWEFHEAVNLRLGKASFPWELFIPRYKYGQKACEEPDCHTASEEPIIPPKPMAPSAIPKSRGLIRSIK